ncbi:DNA polymerase [Mycolicibacterium aubagnense]|uniref:DNA polymerase I n=1 Tax=Mycolicibacterium aubagnense TaxID=319707 RepID=A0ABM7I6R6_9MYCO|nr:DNA polymerase [Mycolicibacterium aubagnense]TLH48971.1 hypothetical protein C1S80_29235 [Mycolicibacterium aubagnense]BBX82247.1 hypothetical protein MAUB_01200 [Mycolicibacterium aubagnense]
MSTHPAVPIVDLPRVAAAQFQFYDHAVGAFLVTEDAALARWIDQLCSQPPAAVAADIETRGLDVNKFTITCVTVAFHLGGDTVALLFDPLRREEHRRLLTRVFDHAARIVFHGGSFDVAPLYAHRLLTREHIRKIGDTLVAARMIRTYAKAGRTLEDLAIAYGVMDDDRITMDEVFAARGLKKDEGWWSTDIDTPTYAVGAMSDTVATLRLWGIPGVTGEGIIATAARYLTTSQLGIGGIGVLNGRDAEQLVEDVQQVNRIVLERTARGYAVDAEFPDRFLAETAEATAAAARVLAAAGIRPGNPADLVNALDARGLLHEQWPRTNTGRLKADKNALEVFTGEHISESLKNPLVMAHRTVFGNEKVLGYVNKVVENAGPTGRLHPEIKILGANATGRMSASRPEIQQFPPEARGVIVADDGDWVSADWKSIEPVVLATASGDRQFLADMKAGKDPYEPVGKMAGVDRKLAKRKMLADMYGQGHKAAALQYGWTIDRAKQVAWAIRDGLPILYKLIDALKAQSEATGHVTTLSGRVVDQEFRFQENGRMVRDVAQRIAPNHFCQGSALDVMHYSILELDRRGLSDHVHLWMHDEIVADSTIAAELAEVMATPPPFLQAVAQYHGMDAFLAVDLNDMGQRWEYV